jgi:prophage regulatory protein
MSDTIQPSPIVLRLKDIQRRLSLSRSAIYSRLADSDFPKPIKLGPRAIGWLQADIDSWIETRRQQSREETVKP